MTGRDEVRLGQVWADNDRRCAGRRLRVVGLDSDPPTPRSSATVVRVDATGRQVADRRIRIRVDRFRPTSTGYRLVSQPPCERCGEQADHDTATCCSSHGKVLCHRCYRRTHFVERCGCGREECT
jgi:hypothetical protein